MFKRWSFIILVVAFAFLFAALLGLLYLRTAKLKPAPLQIQNTSTLLRQIQTLSELTTVKYVFEKLVVLEDVKWYGENRVTLIAHGVVKAGIDFQRMGTNDLQVTQNKVSIDLPPPQILDAYLDDKKTQVLERNTGLMRSFDRDLEQNARRQAADDLKRAARNNGILMDAEERARLQLSSFFHQLGFNEVEFR